MLKTSDHMVTDLERRDVGIFDGVTFVEETLYSDTRVWEIVRRTARTLVLRPTRDGRLVCREDRSGNGWPQVWTEAVPAPDMACRLVRRRQDGSYRAAGSGSRSLRPATVMDGVPVSFADYRY